MKEWKNILQESENCYGKSYFYNNYWLNGRNIKCIDGIIKS